MDPTVVGVMRKPKRGDLNVILIAVPLALWSIHRFGFARSFAFSLRPLVNRRRYRTEYRAGVSQANHRAAVLVPVRNGASLAGLSRSQ